MQTSFTNTKTRNLLKINKLVILSFLATFLSTSAFAQDFFIGMKGGVNFAEAQAIKSHSVFSNTSFSQDREGSERTYDSQFGGDIGSQFGFLIQMETKSGLGFSFEPAYVTYNFGYENNYSWQHPEITEQFIEVAYRHDQKLNYMELPLFMKYSFLKGVVSPYIQGGGFYGFLLDARKSVSQKRTDAAIGGIQELTGDNNEVGITHLLNNNSYGIAAAGGISINTTFVKLSLECGYRHFLNNITNPNARYTDARSSMLSYDVMDDISLKNFQFSMTAMFPLDFMYAPGNGTKGKKTVVPYDLRRGN